MTPEVMVLLADLDEWRTLAELEQRAAVREWSMDLLALLRRLEALGLVHTKDQDRWLWSRWMPEAAFFHFGTRVHAYTRDRTSQNRGLRAKARLQPAPPPTKFVAGPRLALPAADRVGDVSDVLLARRTWRNFSSTPVPLASLATLLKLTWGVQRWGTVRGQGTVALKTSPSGGARHSIEACVLAPNVDGLARGIYHYDAATHELVSRDTSIGGPRIVRLLANQEQFRGAGAFVVMSAVFARSMWKYPSGRAYRAILIEAGHLGQTFCLLATALGLAPFCTMAFRDVALENTIGVDGVTECALYVVGVGTRMAKHARRPGRMRGR